MIKVFLVEDEAVMRNGIKRIIPWEKEGFEFVGEASDGELAYPLIRNEKPDILITDIRMPFMDGLELSRIIKKEMPDVKVIILSGYNDFDYAKSAISIGVTEYLLKPISAEKLLDTLRKVREVILQEREQKLMLDYYRKEMEENLNLQKHNLWINLTTNQLSIAHLLEQGHSVGIDFTASCYQVILFRFLNGEKSSDEEILRLAGEVEKISERWPNILCFDRSPEGWALLLKGNSDGEIDGLREELESYLRQFMEKNQDVEYFGGIGTIVQRLGDVSLSYRSAAKAFAGRFFLKSNQLVNCDSLNLSGKQDGEPIDMTSLRSRKSERELLEKFLKSGTVEEIDDFVERFVESIGEKNLQSFLFRQYTIMDIFFIVSDFLTSLNSSGEELPESCRDINQLVRQTDSETGFCRQISELFREAMLLRDRRSRKKYGELLEEARRFIQENYQSGDLSLQMVASEVNISPSYFSTIFSSETGQTFIEYLTQVRLEKAKELLMCSSMRTAEIGYEVGYKDSHYFSYIFKKVVGCSPKEFKSRRKGYEEV